MNDRVFNLNMTFLKNHELNKVETEFIEWKKIEDFEKD